MANVEITIVPNTTGTNGPVYTLWGVTREQANGAQEILFNTGDVPLPIILAPGTGVFARIKEKSE